MEAAVRRDLQVRLMEGSEDGGRRKRICWIISVGREVSVCGMFGVVVAMVLMKLAPKELENRA